LAAADDLVSGGSFEDSFEQHPHDNLHIGPASGNDSQGLRHPERADTRGRCDRPMLVKPRADGQ
jgi:hypothetical protein